MITKGISPICLDNDDYAQPLQFFVINDTVYFYTKTKYGSSTTMLKIEVDNPTNKIFHGEIVNGIMTRFVLAKNRSQNIYNPTFYHKEKLLVLNTMTNNNEPFVIEMSELSTDTDLSFLHSFDPTYSVEIPNDFIQEWRRLSNIDRRTKIKELTLYDHYALINKVNAEHLYDHNLSKNDIQNLANQYPLKIDRIFLDVISNQSPKYKYVFSNFNDEILIDNNKYAIHIKYRKQLALPNKTFKHYYPLDTFYTPFINPIHSSMNTMDYSFIIHKNEVYLQDIHIGTLSQHFPHTIITRFYSRNIPTLHKEIKSAHHESYILITPYIMHYTPTQIKVHIVINTPEQKHNSPYNLYKTVNTKLFHEDTFKDFSYDDLKYQDIYTLLDSR